MNACAAQVTSYLPKCAVDLAWYLALVVGLARRHRYTTRSLVRQGDLRDYRLVVAACEAAWQGIYAWALTHGIALIEPQTIPF